MSTRNKNVIVIGAGVAGITSAAYLAKAGYKVKVLEKNPIPGGRCGQVVQDGHRFDIGPTMLMMPDVLDRTFNDFEKELHNELDLMRLDPGYHVKLEDGLDLKFSSDMDLMKKQLESIEPGSYKKYKTFMDASYNRYTISMKKVVNRNYYGPLEFFTLANLLMFIKLKAFNNHYNYTGRVFKSEFLRTAYSLQNLYLGQDPYHSTALFTILPAMEVKDGIWFPKGGMYKIVEALVKIALENGVEFLYNTPVNGIKTDTTKVEGVFAGDDFYAADIVVSNADIPFVYKNLLKDKHADKFDKMKYTCSAFVFHWGVSKTYPQLEQHNVFISKDFKESIKHIFNTRHKYMEPSTFYIHAPAQYDTTAAPKGQDSYTIIVQTNNLSSTSLDWSKLKADARDSVIKRLKEEGLEDIDEQIKFEISFTPRSWESKFNLTNGSTFGSLAHNLLQMGYFRPKNVHKKYKNLFFAGGCTHPGNGLPLALTSGRLVSEKVLRTINDK